MTAGAGGSWSHGIHGQEPRGEYWRSAHFFLFIESGVPSHGRVLPTFWTGLPASLTSSPKPLQDIPKGVIPNLVKLALKVNPGPKRN